MEIQLTFVMDSQRLRISVHIHIGTKNWWIFDNIYVSGIFSK